LDNSGLGDGLARLRETDVLGGLGSLPEPILTDGNALDGDRKQEADISGG